MQAASNKQRRSWTACCLRLAFHHLACFATWPRGRLLVTLTLLHAVLHLLGTTALGAPYRTDS